MSTHRHKRLARQIVAALDRHDLDAVLSHFMPDAIWHGFGPTPLEARGYLQATGVILRAFPNVQFPVNLVVAEGDRVAVHHRLCGTHQSAFWGVPPTGKMIEVPALVIFRVDGEYGKVAETWINVELAGLLLQIGALPGQA
jgi:predicted ester cyclase